jgi:L-fuconolactonase
VGAIPQLNPDLFALYESGRFDSVFAACQTLGVPIWLKTMGGLASVPRIARGFPDLQIIVDHIGLMQPPFQARQDPPWKDLPLALALSEFANVSIKVSAPLTLTDEEYPWPDVRRRIHELLGAFGSERLAWASDINRVRGRIGFNSRLRAAATSDAAADNQRGPDAHIPGPPPAAAHYPGKHNYMESLALILYDEQISRADKENMLGLTTRRLLGWPASNSGRQVADQH